jgi:steroid 5-alpha reductase family enzyme
MGLRRSVVGSCALIPPGIHRRWLIFFQFAEYSNLLTHLNLRSLRPEGSRKRVIPHGYGFDWVSLPNYFFEILGWVVFTVMTGSWASKEPFPSHSGYTHILN